jgi:hypothetical protein
MLILLAAVQLILPLGLLAWLGMSPLRSVVGHWLQLAATGLILWALAWAGMWGLPPWWTPYLLGLFWMAVSVKALKHLGSSRLFWPRGWKERVGVVFFVLLGGYAAFIAVDAYAGRTPVGEIVDLASPLRGGPYLVVSGGSTKSVNAHVLTPFPADDKMAAYRGQRFAVDLVKIDGFGLRARGLRPRNPAAYYIFGEPLYAPCDGIVLHAEDGHPDLDVPEMDREHMPGNHVLLECGGDVVLMAHLQSGSVAVTAGDNVRSGDRVGAVGNSGNTAEPHLHIHAQRAGTADAPLSGAPLPIRVDGRFLVRNDRLATD